MKKEKNKDLLPQILEDKLELDVSSSRISLKEIEIATNKTASELQELMTEKLCSMPTELANNIWRAFDEESRNELTYHDNGLFNLELVWKLNITGSELHAAFVSNLAMHIYLLENAALNSPAYITAFTTIQTELLSTCRQLSSAKSDGKQQLMEFLSSFDMDFLSAVVRHEIARYFIDEEGANLDWDVSVSKDEDGIERRVVYVEEGSSDDELLEEPEAFDEGQISKNECEDFKRIFVRGFNVPTCLEFTYWLQNSAPEVYLNVRNIIIFFSEQREAAIWDRTNPLELKSKNATESWEESSERNHLSIASNEVEGLVLADTEKEERRLFRLYIIHHPLKNNFRKIHRQRLDVQAELISKILLETGKDTSHIQSFDQLKKSVWDAIGFTGLMKWIEKQDNAALLIQSSGKKRLFDDMKVLGAEAFGVNAIIDGSLELTKAVVSRLYGWFCLIKIFWGITERNKRFSDLATVKKNKLVWEETITVNTLIFQAVLNTDKLFFSLEDAINFCKAAKESEWVKTMQQSFYDLAKTHEALSAVPIFHERIEYLADRAKNIFLIANEILLSAKKEKQLVIRIKELAKEHAEIYCGGICDTYMSKEKVRANVQFSFTFQLRRTPGAGKYTKQAEDLLEKQIEEFGYFPTSKDVFGDDEGEVPTNSEASPTINFTDDFRGSEVYKDLMDKIKKRGSASSGFDLDEKPQS